MLARAKVDVPSGKSLMTSPLSKFIEFSANDCGYADTRYKLIANWVHQLYVKAKTEASKSDNLNWKQATYVPFREEFWTAACKELDTLEFFYLPDIQMKNSCA